MKITDRIIIDAEPKDVSQALINNQSIPSGYELKEFTYTLSKITDKTALEMMRCEEYKITHCRLVLEKQGSQPMTIDDVLDKYPNKVDIKLALLEIIKGAKKDGMTADEYEKKLEELFN